MQEQTAAQPANITAAVAALDALSPSDLVQALIWISQKYRVDAQELRDSWQDKEAGKIWDIAAEGLEQTAEAVQKHWDTL